MINKRKIILASSSPRRQQLLSEAGFWFEVHPVPFNEVIPEGTPTWLAAQHIAEEKALSASSLIKDDHILLTADSIVVLQDKVFGKPEDFKHAYHMLASLSGKKHLVHTGVCLKDHEKTISFTGTSEVYFREFTHEEINWYLHTCKPYDKAGSYAVQEWVGLCKISHIGGSYANIMGLPTDLVYEGLKHFDGAISFPQ